MADKRILDYIENARKNKIADSATRSTLAAAGWGTEEIGKAFIASLPVKKKPVLLIILVSVCLVAMLISYTYFFMISPSFVDKPYIEKPEIKESMEKVLGSGDAPISVMVEEEHVEYIVNEIGGYKLHDNPLTGEPAVFEIAVTDTGQKFFIKIENNIPKTASGFSGQADLRISGKGKDILDLIDSTSFSQDIVNMVKDSRIMIVVLTDEKTLVMKGYKGVYDKITGNFAKITD